MSRHTFTRSLTISQASGIEVNINLVLPEKPVREAQKLKTLTKYVQRYPSGWKKRLELADLLYGMGKWSEAVEQYSQVIERQPQLIPVQLKLGKILQLMGREKEAIEVYKTSLSLLCHRKFSSPGLSNVTQSQMANKAHIVGLIEICLHNFPKAVKAFSLATTFEPDNPSHWLALGKVQKSIGNNIDALKAFEAILCRYPDDLIALINIYDTLMALGKRNNQWYEKAQERLNQAIILAPDNYQVLKRQIENRFRMKLVSGKEGKQTKQLLNTLLKQAPNSAVAYQLKAYYYQVREELESCP